MSDQTNPDPTTTTAPVAPSEPPAPPVDPVPPTPPPVEPPVEEKPAEIPASPGKPAFDHSSQRITELFDASDIVFFREGPNGTVHAIPAHEAETRFVEITKRESSFKDSKTIEALDLADGSKVTINGTQVIITPADGPAEVDEAPDLNLKPADTGV